MKGLVYVDSCVLIYALERDPQFGAAARQSLANQLAEQRTLAISPLVQLECLVHPLARRESQLLLRYQSLLHLKTPDALHLAIALQHGCEALITNDNRLEQIKTELRCVSISTHP